ncbi:hypothetical protein [Duganella sp. BuS-21]|uniref:hypothetical protein n=1 Tax=Duganella sp. BuS-21 TaxID=2943848 RepID=UPI0035A6C1AD
MNVSTTQAYSMKSTLGCVAIALLVGGCVSTQRAVPPPVVLENTGTEFPTMCMLLQPNGTLEFRGGFGFYTQSTWRRADNDTLLITLGGKEPFPTAVFKEQTAKRNGGLLSFDEKRREIIYRFNANTEFLNFGNFNFYRAETCHAS